MNRGKPPRRPGELRPQSQGEVELVIDSLAAGGDGVGRLADGRVVFVPFTAPGDRLRVGIVAQHRRYLRGQVLALLEAGPGRTDPLCPVFGTCGGCSWQHLDASAQRAAKRDILRDAMVRIAHLKVPEDLEIVASPAPYGYRSRARVLAQGGRVGFRRRRSHAVCPAPRCPVLAPALDATLHELAERPPAANGEWELAAGSDGEVCVDPGGRRAVSIRCGSDRLRISAGVFVQANALLREVLAAAVHEAVGEGNTALELHAGAGFFTLGLARRFGRVVAVEADATAAQDLEANLRAAGLEEVVELHVGDAESYLEQPALAELAPAVLLLDPPRTGLGVEAMDRLARLRIPRVVYLSCDPATLARDVAVLADRGYSLASLVGFDMFPQTSHLEVLSVFEPG